MFCWYFYVASYERIELALYTLLKLRGLIEHLACQRRIYELSASNYDYALLIAKIQMHVIQYDI